MKQALSSGGTSEISWLISGALPFFYFGNCDGFHFWRSTSIILDLPGISCKQIREVNKRLRGNLNRIER